MAGIDSFTKLMLHCDGVDTSTTFTDDSDSGHTVTAYGDAQVDTSYKQFGTGSLLLDGTGDYIRATNSSDFAFGTGDFTIEMWIRPTQVTSSMVLYDARDVLEAKGVVFYIDNGKLVVYDPDSGVHTSTTTLSTNTWQHVCIVRYNGTLKFYVDGVEAGGSFSFSTNLTTEIAVIGRALPENASYFSGHMDEIRVSKGIARWTSNFTPPTDPYSVATQKIDINETIYLSDLNDLNIPTEVINILETLYLSEVSDISIFQQSINVNETIYLDDSNIINIPKEVINIDESIYIDDLNTINIPNAYGVRILSYNPLIILAGINSIKLIHVDISTPASPVSTIYNISGISNAKDLVLNESNDYFYLGGANGTVVKVEKTNLNNQTIINTLDTDDFQKVTSLDSFFRTFGSTNNVNGEVVMIDESTINKINTDIRWSKRITTTISCLINTILGKKINTDIRYSKKISNTILTDMRWLKYVYNDLSQYPIDYSDIQVKINSVDLAPLDDVDLKSIVITHTKEEYSTASFTLHRKHDNPNYDNQGNASQITNQNAVQIYINGHLEFNGTIQNFVADSEAETIIVNARMDEPSNNRQIKSIPLASVGEQLHLYHCLLNSISVENPVLNTQAVIINEDSLYWSGSEWVGDLDEAQVFASHSAAQSSINANLDEFTSQQVYPINYNESPDYYKGVQVNLGTEIKQQIMRYSSFMSGSALADAIEAGTFTPKQNWVYFWFASVQNFVTGSTTGHNYIKTLGSLSADTWKITSAAYKYQKQLDDEKNDLGFYYVGSAPYKLVSIQNGRLIAKDKWVDKNDGLYRERDKAYDYEQFAKDVASLEYAKLKNINSQILPITSGEIDITLDGYYYYNLKLLTRINLSNTTASSVYKNSNGFPIAIKTITINTNSMRVTLSCNNQLSLEETQEIDRNYPDVNSSEYLYPKQSVLNNRKYDPNRGGFIT